MRSCDPRASTISRLVTLMLAIASGETGTSMTPSTAVAPRLEDAETGQLLRLAAPAGIWGNPRTPYTTSYRRLSQSPTEPARRSSSLPMSAAANRWRQRQRQIVELHGAAYTPKHQSTRRAEHIE
jgi:hypothetical protein